MKFISFILILTNAFLYGQTTPPSLNWSSLIGKWELTKATVAVGKNISDISKDRKSRFLSFYEDLKYQDEIFGYPKNPFLKTITDGKYKIDKEKKQILYEDYTSINKCTDGAYEDYVQKGGGNYSLTVLKLTDKEMVLFSKGISDISGLEEGKYYYFKKIK